MATDPGDADAKAPEGDDPFELCGETIGDKYRIDEAVGKGGFGVVYRGVHTGFDEPIAVKCLKIPGELGEAERQELLRRLKDEGRVLHRLSKSTSGIVQALDVGAMTTPNGRWVPYLVLEWLEGETLAQHLRHRLTRGKGALSLDAAIELLEPAARALEVAHRQKVAHRDVKPENIYLTEVSGERTLKVLDFGIAKVLTQHATFTAAPAATQQQASAFTPSYGAPEQFNKKRGATGPWTDVFALALIIVEAVSGERALDGDDATQLYIAAADPSSRPTLRYKGIETSDEVELVLSRALAIEPNDRYQHAGRFWTALCAAAGKKTSAEPAASDVSETGEYVSNHDIDIDRKMLSERPSDVDDSAEDPAGDAEVPNDTEPAEDNSDTERAPRSAPLKATKRDGAAAAVVGRKKEVDKPRVAPKVPAQQASPQEPASNKSGVPSNRKVIRSRPPRDELPRNRRVSETNAAEVVKPESSRWLPVVVLVALVGAAVVYWQLRKIEETGIQGPTHTRPTRPSARPRPSPQPVDSAIVDAGADADLDASADAEAGIDFDPPPDMVFVPPAPDTDGNGVFIDRTEVRTSAYEECVKAGVCVRANRIVITEAALRALGIDDPISPEQHGDAWVKRCNQTRDAGDHPINCVKHAHAVEYCRHKAKRLPTAVEWGLAAGGAAGQRYPWGDAQPECDRACYDLDGSCLGSEKEVASCATGARSGDRTRQGVMDLGGNVSEWVSDKAASKDRTPWYMLLGGSFIDDAKTMQVSETRSVPAVTAHVTIGFRCALDVPDGYVAP
jgi:serine/threonine protein kinase